jgi:hypothetical protein
MPELTEEKAFPHHAQVSASGLIVCLEPLAVFDKVVDNFL